MRSTQLFLNILCSALEQIYYGSVHSKRFYYRQYQRKCETVLLLRGSRSLHRREDGH